MTVRIRASRRGAAWLCGLAIAAVGWTPPLPAAPFDVYYRPGPQARWTFYGGRETRAAADAAAAELASATGDETRIVPQGEPHPNAVVAGPVDRTVAIRGTTYVARPGLGYRPGFYRWGGGPGYGYGGGWGWGGFGGGWGGYGGGYGGSHHSSSSSHHHHHHSSTHHGQAGNHPTSHASAGRAGGRSGGHHAAGHHAHTHSHSHSHGHAHRGRR